MQTRPGASLRRAPSSILAMTSAAVDLLSVDVAAITAAVTAKALEAEKAEIENMDEKALLAEAAKIEAELQKACAALEKKKGGNSTASAASAPTGITANFEGTPIDCGRIAAVVVAAIEEDETYLEAALAAAKAALERKNSGKSDKAAPASATTMAAPAAPSTPPAAPSTPSKATRSSSSLAEKLRDPNSPLMKMGSKAVEVLDETAEKVGQPRGVIVAAVIGAAAAAGAALAGLFGKARK